MSTGARAHGTRTESAIGWFLTSAAAAEEAHERIRHQLRDVRVAAVMTEHPRTVRTDLSVGELLDQHILASRYSAFPVVDDAGRPAGLLTLNRVKELPPDRRSDARVADIACSLDDVPVARRGDALADLLPRLAGCADGRALVVDGGEVVGIVSPTDVARQLEIVDLREAREAEHV